MIEYNVKVHLTSLLQSPYYYKEWLHNAFPTEIVGNSLSNDKNPVHKFIEFTHVLTQTFYVYHDCVSTKHGVSPYNETWRTPEWVNQHVLLMDYLTDKETLMTAREVLSLLNRGGYDI